MYTNAHTNHKSYNRFTCIPTTTKIHKHLYTTLLFVVVYVFDDAVEIMIMMLCAVRLVMVLFCAVGFVRLDLWFWFCCVQLGSDDVWGWVYGGTIVSGWVIIF